MNIRRLVLAAKRASSLSYTDLAKRLGVSRRVLLYYTSKSTDPKKKRVPKQYVIELLKELSKS